VEEAAAVDQEGKSIDLADAEDVSMIKRAGAHVVLEVRWITDWVAVVTGLNIDFM
jgi:hypothetical protein